MVKILVGTLLALTAANALAGNLYIYKEKDGQPLLSNVTSPSKKLEPTKKVKATYYKDGALVTTYSTYFNDGFTTNNNSNSSSNQRIIKPIENSKSTLEFAVPDGYRLPTKADVVGDWKRFDAPNNLKADFNGDGIVDEAYILPKKSSNVGYGVFVSMSKANEFQMFKLTDSDDMSPQSFAIELAEPSNKIWKTACGKGSWECEIDEPAEIKITKPSVMFCYIESACTIYLLGNDKSSFKEIKFSD